MSTLSKRNLLIGALAALASVAAVGYATSGSTTTAGFEHVALDVPAMQATGGVIVDIRTPPEWHQTGVIDGALLIEFDFDNPVTFLPQIADKIADGRDLVLICRSGNRTQVVADYLARQVPNRIVSIEGGIKKVIAGGYKPVPPS